MVYLRKLLFLILLTLLATACAQQPLPSPKNTISPTMQNSPNPILQVGNKQLSVEIVTTHEAMARGLSGREKLGKDQGMLFDYGTTANVTPAFWMPNMKFDLDIIWINDGKIIGITKNVPAPKSPDEQLERYYPPSPVDQVLEVNAGWSEENAVTNGDTVKLIH